MCVHHSAAARQRHGLASGACSGGVNMGRAYPSTMHTT